MIKKLLLVYLLLLQFQINAQVSQKVSLSPLLEISIVGTAVEGWEADVVLQPLDGTTYQLQFIALKSGDLKFRQDRSWVVNWGSNAFPTGVGTQDGENIPVTAGDYYITFNSETGAYTFEKVCTCPAVIAPVCANGKTYGNSCEAECAGETTWTNGECKESINVWISGTAITERIKLHEGGIGFMPFTPKLFSTVQNFNTGTLKFEVQEADMLYHMAGQDFPSGVAAMSYEITIPVKEGTYALVFDLETGQYDFHATPYVSIAGVNLTQVDNQGNYVAKKVGVGEITVEVLDNEYGNDALMLLYGNNFPQGVATMEVFAPVKTIPGIYNIYYNTNTKEYRFETDVECICPEVYAPVCANGKTYGNSCEAQCAGETEWVEGECESLSISLSQVEKLEIYPNPVKDILNISSNDLNQAKIYDCTGRLVKEVIITNQKIDFSDFTSGNYILKIQSSTNQETIKIVKE